MKASDLAKIKKGFAFNKSNIVNIEGCYVSADGSVVSRFSQPLSPLGEEAGARVLSSLKKSISGQFGRNIVEIAIEENGSAYKNFNLLRDNEMKDDKAIVDLFEKIQRANIISDDPKSAGYIILSAYNVVDLTKKKKNDDGTTGDEDDYNDNRVFSFIVCGVFAVKNEAALVSYFASDKKFKNVDYGCIVGTPLIGFMYPSIESGGAVKDKVVYRVQKENDIHREFVSNVFGVEPPESFAEKKVTFGNIMKESLESFCSVDTIAAISSKIAQQEEEDKAIAKEEKRHYTPAPITVEDIGQMMKQHGVDRGAVNEFVEQYNNAFTASEKAENGDKAISPREYFDSKKLKIEMEGIKITADVKLQDLITTKVINGQTCIIIATDSERTGLPIVNGLPTSGEG